MVVPARPAVCRLQDVHTPVITIRDSRVFKKVAADLDKVYKAGGPSELPMGKEDSDILQEIDKHEKVSVQEPEFQLWLSDGRVVKSLEELRDALKTMEEHVFKEHVTKNKNEFADWVEEILEEKDLARKMRSNRSQARMRKVVEKAVGQGVTTLPKTVVKREEEKKIDDVVTYEEDPLGEAEAIEHIAEETLEALEQPVSHHEHVHKKEKHIEPLEQEQKPGPLDALEKELEKREQALQAEEDLLSQRRIELAKKKYELIKERGELERKKFETFLKQQPEPMDPVSVPTDPLGKDSLLSLIEETRSVLSSGQLDTAKEKLDMATRKFPTVILEPHERKDIEYQIMELETEIKLATL